MSFADASPGTPGLATHEVIAKSSRTSVAAMTDTLTPLIVRRSGVQAALSSVPAPSSGMP